MFGEDEPVLEEDDDWDSEETPGRNHRTRSHKKEQSFNIEFDGIIQGEGFWK